MKYSLLLKIMCVSTSFCVLQAAALGGAGDGSGDGGALPSSRSASDEEDRPATRVVHASAAASATLYALPCAPHHAATLESLTAPIKIVRGLPLPNYTRWAEAKDFERYLQSQVHAKPHERIMLKEIPEVARAYYQMVLEEYKHHAGKIDPEGTEMIRYIADFSGGERSFKRIKSFIEVKEDFDSSSDLERYISNSSYTPLSDLYDMLKARKQERDEEDYTVLYAKWCRFVKRVNSFFPATRTPRGYTPLGYAAAVPIDEDATDEVTAGAGAAGVGESKKDR